MARPYLEELSKLIVGLNLPNSEEYDIECKHFFSGAALYVNGKIFASLSPAGLGLKLPEDTKSRLIEEGDGAELRYFEKSPVKKEYVALSQVVQDDKERLNSLLSQSINYVIGGESAG
jgi:TfoX/Sxy family transcriptional regulator of competence genes